MSELTEKNYTDELLEYGAYDLNEQTESVFMHAIVEEIIFHYEHNAMYKRFCDRKGFNPYCENIKLSDIPPVSVSVFKNLGAQLSSVPDENIRLKLQSSATSGIPSTVVVDKITSKRQSKAMVKVLQHYIGKGTRPFLVMDIDPSSEFKHLLGARYAAVSGYLKFSSKTGFFLKADSNGVSYFDVNAMQNFLRDVGDKPVILFGFTYILYSNVLKAVDNSQISVRLPKGSKIIHIGGWKKLESEKISKELFNQKISACFGLESLDVIDIYGFTEQMGLNYPSDIYGYKHTPVYSRVIVRDPVTKAVLPDGKEGLLEFVTPIPHSYPGNAVLTDDLGMIVPGDDESGIQGTRFVITGRMKKAEVRGCGDILSEKLTFKKKTGVDTRNHNLQCILTSTVPKADDPVEQLKGIVSDLKSAQKWLCKQPSDAIIGLIGEAASVWKTTPDLQYLNQKGLQFVSSWCDEKHLKQIANFGLHGDYHYLDSFKDFPDSDKHMIKANPRGLCCHWLAGNVQILGMFALVQSIIAGNANLLKVSSRDDGVFESLLNTFHGLSYTTESGYRINGDDLLKTIAVVYFDHDADKIGEEMSKSADIRIAWGGQDAVTTVAGYPSLIGSETVIFGPKLSFSVIAKEALFSEQEAKKLARRVSVDVSVFDQTGCASPHNLYIEEGGVVSPKRFIEILGAAMDRTAVQMPKGPMTAEEVSKIHSIRGVYDFKGTVYGGEDLTWTILADDETRVEAPVYFRTLFVHSVKSIFDTVNLITPDIQTIGLEAPKDKAVKYATEATAAGVQRLPQIGRMLNFEIPWDGIILLDRLVKWNTLGGPLR